MPIWLAIALALFSALSTLITVSIGVIVFLSSRFQSKATADTNLRISRLEDRALSPERQRQLEDRVVKLETLLTLYERQTDKVLRSVAS